MRPLLSIPDGELKDTTAEELLERVYRFSGSGDMSNTGSEKKGEHYRNRLLEEYPDTMEAHLAMFARGVCLFSMWMPEKMSEEEVIAKRQECIAALSHAAQKVPRAAHLLGIVYEFQERDADAALKWYRQATDLGWTAPNGPYGKESDFDTDVSGLEIEPGTRWKDVEIALSDQRWAHVVQGYRPYRGYMDKFLTTILERIDKATKDALANSDGSTELPSCEAEWTALQWLISLYGIDLCSCAGIQLPKVITSDEATILKAFQILEIDDSLLMTEYVVRSAIKNKPLMKVLMEKEKEMKKDGGLPQGIPRIRDASKPQYSTNPDDPVTVLEILVVTMLRARDSAENLTDLVKQFDIMFSNYFFECIIGGKKESHLSRPIQSKPVIEKLEIWTNDQVTRAPDDTSLALLYQKGLYGVIKWLEEKGKRTWVGKRSFFETRPAVLEAAKQHWLHRHAKIDNFIEHLEYEGGWENSDKEFAAEIRDLKMAQLALFRLCGIQGCSIPAWPGFAPSSESSAMKIGAALGLSKYNEDKSGFLDHEHSLRNFDYIRRQAPELVAPWNHEVFPFLKAAERVYEHFPFRLPDAF